MNSDSSDMESTDVVLHTAEDEHRLSDGHPKSNRHISSWNNRKRRADGKSEMGSGRLEDIWSEYTKD